MGVPYLPLTSSYGRSGWAHGTHARAPHPDVRSTKVGPRPDLAPRVNVTRRKGTPVTDPLTLDVPGVRAMAWMSGKLYDVADGWRPLYPELSTRTFASYGDSFDAAVAAPAGDVCALIATAGTKALLLDASGRVLRELNRSFYHAGAYRYPLALFTLPDGRTGLVHCPRHYNQLEVEVAATGEPLCSGDERAPADIFHSRLAVSDDSTLLLSAGWLWHPWGSAHAYDLTAAVAGQTAGLDGVGDVFDWRGLIAAEVAGACFIGNDVAFSTSDEPNDPEGPDDLAPLMLARWSTTERRLLWRRQLDHSPGDLASWSGHILALNQHLRLYSADSGELLHEWPDLLTGESTSSITWSNTFRGPARVAIDPISGRLAHTDGERVRILEPWS